MNTTRFLIVKTEVPLAIWETLYVTLISTLIALVIGLPLGVLLAVGDKDGIIPLPAPLRHFLNILINLLRSVPFFDPDRRGRSADTADYRKSVRYGGIHCSAGYRGVSVYCEAGRRLYPRGQPEHHRNGTEHRCVALTDHHKGPDPRERPEPDLQHNDRADNDPRLYRHERRYRRRRTGQARYQLRILPLQIPRDDHHRHPADSDGTAVPDDRHKTVGGFG